MKTAGNIPPRNKFGAKTEELLGDRPGDRALRLSDMDSVISDHILKVIYGPKGPDLSGGGGGPSLSPALAWVI